MSAVLPDISLTETAPSLSPLEWVGMQGIDVPIIFVEPGYRRTLHARADAQVNLPAVHVKGIHMSRLYRLLGGIADQEPLSPGVLRKALVEMVDSHRDCDSDSARLRLTFDLLMRRPALLSQGLEGWKAYPVRMNAELIRGVFTLRAQVTVKYSSTCPCSAALSRQLIERAFQAAFDDKALVKRDAVAAWLQENATLATPHSQRSEARIGVDIAPDVHALRLIRLIDLIEAALGTPLQTAVKRADEQAFASLNGRNLMFVEDAARRIQKALSEDFVNPRIHVRHLESLHPHDAAAWAGRVPREGAV